jgi:mediator of RNA polymerase II transcription subunit 14
MASNIPLAVLLDSLLQKSYHELTVLAELLPRKSDVDRKIGIVGFARQTRLQLVRLLALVKWAGSSDSVQKCSEMSELLSQQSWLYEDTANQLVHLARHQLLLACMPNFSLAPALDVLCTGSYPRLPSCIRDNLVPPSPLTGPEADAALSLLTVAIRRRLLWEQIPPQMTVRSLEKGIVVFEVPHEFRLSLSVVGDDLKLPWRLVNLEVLVGVGLPGGPPLCHSQQTRYLTQLAQSHLVAAEYPLTHVFTLLHTFCLSLVLDCLHTQVYTVYI